MGSVTIPNRPLGTDQRSIELVLADFDAITNFINGGNLDNTNIAANAGIKYSQLDQSAWTTYTPVFTAASGGWVDGAGSTKVGRYRQVGKLCVVRIYLACGSGMAGGTNAISVTLPVASVNDTPLTEQDSFITKLYASVNGTEWLGFGLLPGNSNSLQIFFPINGTTSQLAPLSNSGTNQVPATGNYPLQPGSNLVISGTYETA